MFEPTDDIEWSPEHRRRTRDELAGQVQRDTRRRKARRWWMIGVPSVVVAAVGVTAGIALLAPVTEKNYVHCLARAELNEADGTYPGTQVIVGSTPDGGPIPIEDAIAACTQVWQEGGLDADDPDGQSGDPGTPPPPPNPELSGPVPAELTVCVMRDGAAGVVPGDRDVCLALGLPRRVD